MKIDFEKIGVIAALTIYLFICGSLYSFLYWFNFHFDITNLITISDIPKSIFNAMFFAVAPFGLIITGTISAINSYRRFNTYISFIVILLFLATVGYMMYCFYSSDNTFTIMFLITNSFSFYALTLFFKTETNKVLVSVLSEKEFLVACFVIIAISCAVAGGLASSKTFFNRYGTNYVLKAESPDTTIIKLCENKKLLGYIGDKIILSDKMNKSVVIINQSAVNAISFTLDSSFAKKH